MTIYVYIYVYVCVCVYISIYVLEKAVATHSSVLAWRIPGAGEPGGLRLWGFTELDTTEVT